MAAIDDSTLVSPAITVGPSLEGLPPRQYFSLREAASILGLTYDALKKMVGRQQRRDGRDVVCHIMNGVKAVKIGRGPRARWRVKFD